ncbi:DUF5681 domain-containing protein [Sinorhizobium fredii]|uniref:DUF5681 domain-containing protein n=1 Tax=Rhizobium fredii TaxID=380 RepID=UPI0018729AAC|nr:DUF5681 domain-containing protein [Sinorhizobium fredii]
MTELTQPEWMKGFAPKPEPGNPMWKKGGPSPNPNGRPKGVLDRRTKVTQALMDDAPAVARVVIDAALEGDMQAASLVLSRIAPALRSQSEKVTFDFDPSLPISQQIEQVLAAIASGTVAPDVGKQIIEALGTLSNARATEELEQRILLLEAKQVG